MLLSIDPELFANPRAPVTVLVPSRWLAIVYGDQECVYLME